MFDAVQDSWTQVYVDRLLDYSKGSALLLFEGLIETQYDAS